ncbi:MAG: 3D domain-containing protein [Rivularia sp. (in: cyanobacteria)]
MTCVCGNSYIVKSGDTLALIAEGQLGDGSRWKEITKQNCTPFTEEEARRLQPGDEVCLPNGSTPTPIPNPIPAPTPTPPPISEEMNLEATFYASENVGCNFPATGVFGITLNAALAGRFEPRCPNAGENVARIQCATDPNLIPRLTNFTLVWDGQEVPAQALDVGTAIIGNRIDILVDTIAEAIELGRKTVKVIL